MTPVGFYSPALNVANLQAELATRRALERAPGQAGSDSPAPAIGQSQGAAAQAPFDNVLGRFVNEVNAKQLAATDTVKGLLSGQNVPLHQAMISMEEASVSFQLMVEVRNKLLEGYQELMRMQV